MNDNKYSNNNFMLNYHLQGTLQMLNLTDPDIYEKGGISIIFFFICDY